MIAVKDRKMPRYCAECFVNDCPHKSGAAIRLHYRHEYGRHAGCLLVETEERNVGHWIRKPIRNDKGGCIGAEMLCSCCGKDNRHDEYMDFCPNCGSKMSEILTDFD